MSRAVAQQTLFQVRLKGGKVWRGTEQELRTQHPNWLPYARPVQPSAEAVEESYELDFQADSHPGRVALSGRKLYPTASAQVEYDFQEEIVHTTIPRRSSAQRETEEQPAADRQRRKPHPNVYHAQPPEVIHMPAPKRRVSGWFILGVGMLLMLGMWIAGMKVANWWTDVQNNTTYTAAFRTYSVDAVVGHNGDSQAKPSHFIVQNDKRRIIVVELPADDASKAFIYIGPRLIGDGQERTPVTVTFQLNTGTGKIDMVLHVEDQTYVFTNNGKKFVPQTQQ